MLLLLLQVHGYVGNGYQSLFLLLRRSYCCCFLPGLCCRLRYFVLLWFNRRCIDCRRSKEGLPIFVCVQLHKKRLPQLNQLQQALAIPFRIDYAKQYVSRTCRKFTSFWASIAPSKKVSTPLLKSSTFSLSNLSSSPLIRRPMSSNSNLAW